MKTDKHLCEQPAITHIFLVSIMRAPHCCRCHPRRVPGPELARPGVCLHSAHDRYGLCQGGILTTPPAPPSPLDAPVPSRCVFLPQASSRCERCRGCSGAGAPLPAPRCDSAPRRPSFGSGNPHRLCPPAGHCPHPRGWEPSPARGGSLVEGRTPGQEQVGCGSRTRNAFPDRPGGSELPLQPDDRLFSVGQC